MQRILTRIARGLIWAAWRSGQEKITRFSASQAILGDSDDRSKTYAAVRTHEERAVPRVLLHHYRLSTGAEIRRDSAERQADKLGPWLMEPAASFSVCKARAARRADVAEEERASGGPGVNRLKKIKRQMYRRGQFDPLWRHVCIELIELLASSKSLETKCKYDGDT